MVSKPLPLSESTVSYKNVYLIVSNGITSQYCGELTRFMLEAAFKGWGTFTVYRICNGRFQKLIPHTLGSGEWKAGWLNVQSYSES